MTDREMADIIKAMIMATDMLPRQAIYDAFDDVKKCDIDRVLAELQEIGGDVYDIGQADDHFFCKIKTQYNDYIKKTRKPPDDLPHERQALTEVLATVVMHQPVTRSEIEAFRGVQVNISILHDLQSYGWIKVAKRTKNDAYLYVTTPKFLRDFGLSSVREFEDKIYSKWVVETDTELEPVSP